MIEFDDAGTLLSPVRGLDEMEDCCFAFITSLSSTAIEWKCHCCICLLCLISSCTIYFMSLQVFLTIRLKFPSLSSITVHLSNHGDNYLITVIITWLSWSWPDFLGHDRTFLERKFGKRKTRRLEGPVAVEILVSFNREFTTMNFYNLQEKACLCRMVSTVRNICYKQSVLLLFDLRRRILMRETFIRYTLGIRNISKIFR